MAGKASSPKATRKTTKRPGVSISTQEVAEVAYVLYVQRGRMDGYDRQDWFEAEKIVQKRRRSKK